MRLSTEPGQAHSHLALSGQSRLELADFSVELADGELQVTRHPDVPSGQLELSEADDTEISAGDFLEGM